MPPAIAGATARAIGSRDPFRRCIMLFGRLPGDVPEPSPLYAALPPYATLVGQYLDRFGPYRLQAYNLQPLPSVVAPTPPGAVPLPPPPLAPAPTYSKPHDWHEPVPRSGGAGRNSLSGLDPVGRGLGVLSGMDRPDAIDRINAARRAGLINDANRHVRAGAPIGRAGGVGTPGVGGGFVSDGSRVAASSGGSARGKANGGATDRQGKGTGAGKTSSHGSASHGRSGRRPV
jgi:hypothetical protein